MKEEQKEEKMMKRDFLIRYSKIAIVSGLGWLAGAFCGTILALHTYLRICSSPAVDMKELCIFALCALVLAFSGGLGATLGVIIYTVKRIDKEEK